MPFNAGGVYSLVASYFAQPGTTIRTEQHNPVFEDVGAALSQTLVRDGRAPMTGPLNMNGFAITGVAAGDTPTSVATLGQAMPIGAVIDFAGPTAPTGWALCYGQAVSRVTYAALFTLIGTTYGAGDGSTTFNLPDLRGRVSASPDNMGGTAANRLTTAAGFTPTTIGAAGGAQLVTISAAQLPVVTPSFTGTQGTVSVTSTTSDIAHSGSIGGISSGGGTNAAALSFSGSFIGGVNSSGLFTPSGTVSSFGSGGAHGNVQPTFIMNKIIRVSYDG